MTAANYYTTLTAQCTRVINKIKLIEIHIKLLAFQNFIVTVRT